MRIDLNTSVPPAVDASQSGKAAGGLQSAKRGEDPAPDTAKFSSDCARVLALASQAAQAPGIRQQKIAQLSALVRVGNYSADAKQTAAALLSHMAGEPAA